MSRRVSGSSNTSCTERPAHIGEVDRQQRGDRVEVDAAVLLQRDGERLGGRVDGQHRLAARQHAAGEDRGGGGLLGLLVEVLKAEHERPGRVAQTAS